MNKRPIALKNCVASNDADLNISLCGSFYDTALGVFGSDYTQVLGNDDFCGLQSEVTCVLSAGTYYIVVSGYGASEGDYVINVWENEPPSPLIGYNMYRDGNMVNNETRKAKNNNYFKNSFGLACSNMRKNWEKIHKMGRTRNLTYVN